MLKSMVVVMTVMMRGAAIEKKYMVLRAPKKAAWLFLSYSIQSIVLEPMAADDLRGDEEVETEGEMITR